MKKVFKIFPILFLLLFFIAMMFVAASCEEPVRDPNQGWCIKAVPKNGSSVSVTVCATPTHFEQQCLPDPNSSNGSGFEIKENKWHEYNDHELIECSCNSKNLKVVCKE